MKQPPETQLREVEISDVIRLLHDNLPPGSKAFTYGRVEVLMVPPDGTRGWFVSAYRPDRVLEIDEFVYICKLIVPNGIKLSCRVDNIRAKDNNFHAIAYEEVKKNGDPPYSSP